eukprot:67582_1
MSQHILDVCFETQIIVFGESFDFTLNVGRIVNSLCTSKVDQFMFIWKFECENEPNKASLNEVFCNLCSLSTRIKVVQLGKRFIITNKNCKINGYQNEFK